jgi:HAE1 family hydrophobic/amphiphilic exporter-1
MALPISVVATFILLYFGKMTLNIATMGGLALGIGRVVDDAIVVLENIFRHRTLGERPKEASMIGASEVSTAVLAVTVTTIIVFVPILFVKGLAGMMFRPMAYTVTLALAASYFVAMVLVPVLTSRFLKVEKMGNPDPPKLTFLRRLFNFSQRIFDSIDENYQSLVGWAITHKKWIVILVLGILIITLPLVKFIGAEFLPEVDQGYFQMIVKMPVGTDLESTNQVMAQIEEIIITNVPELKIIAVSSGLSGEGMEALDAIFQGVSGSHAAAVWVELVPPSKRSRSIFEIMM